MSLKGVSEMHQGSGFTLVTESAIYLKSGFGVESRQNLYHIGETKINLGRV